MKKAVEQLVQLIRIDSGPTISHAHQYPVVSWAGCDEQLPRAWSVAARHRLGCVIYAGSA